MVPHYRNYRIYLLDVSDHFLAAKDVVCETDQEAFAQAADLIGSHAGAELWEQTRLVGRLGSGRGRPKVARKVENAIRTRLARGEGMLRVAKGLGVGVSAPCSGSSWRPGSACLRPRPLPDMARFQ
jgi:hypothetical protein